MAPTLKTLVAALSTALVVNASPVREHQGCKPKPPKYGHPPNKDTYWPGLEDITRMIVFGDSYTTTGFEVNETQPSPVNPLGNPPYPGYTSSNGPNWVDFLTTTYNATNLQTLNLAYGGAVVDERLIAQYLPTVLSFRNQVEDEFLPLYADREQGTFTWDSDNTLFAAFFGINDVGNAYQASNASDIFAADFVTYASLMDTLYQSGARNFLFLNVPPVDRAPLTVAQGAEAQALEASTIEAWNANLTALAANFSNTYEDTTIFTFDTHALFSTVLDNPSVYPQTAAYVNTTDYCQWYENGTATWYSEDPRCGVPVDEYFWLNTLHPTFRVHNATAAEIAGQLSSGKGTHGGWKWD